MTKTLFYNLVGFLMVTIGVIGIFLPLLPTTPFLLLAAFCFNKGSPKFHALLLSHKVLGPPIRDWNENKVIHTKAKIIATLMIAASSAWVLTKGSIPLFGKIGYSITVLSTLGFILSRKSNR